MGVREAAEWDGLRTGARLEWTRKVGRDSLRLRLLGNGQGFSRPIGQFNLGVQSFDPDQFVNLIRLRWQSECPTRTHCERRGGSPAGLHPFVAEDRLGVVAVHGWTKRKQHHATGFL